LASVVITVLWKLANSLGVWLATYLPRTGFSDTTFMKAAILFLLISVATGHYMTHGGAKT
jgi:hypothetical protein